MIFFYIFLYRIVRYNKNEIDYIVYFRIIYEVIIINIFLQKTMLFSILLCLYLTLFVSPSSANEKTYIINGTITTDDSRQPHDDIKTIENYNTWWNHYTDYANGYSINYPINMNVDVSLSPIRTLFTNEQTTIEVYYDNFTNTASNAHDYIHYGNRFTDNTKDHSIERDETFFKNNYKVHLLKWTRRHLSKVPNDKNYYVSGEIIKNSNEVYTIFIKSNQPIENELDIINSFTAFNPQGTPYMNKPYGHSKTPMNPETKAFWQKHFAPTSTLQWGVFEPSAPEVMRYLTTLEEKLDSKFSFILRYQTLDEALPLYGLQKAYENHNYVELTLQTIRPGLANALSGNHQDPNASVIYDILDGHYDDYLHEYAKQLKTFGHPIIFRLNNEMNGDWCWYSAYYTGKDAELYKALWIYIHTIFNEHDVDNVIWVWNPHDVSRPDFKWNHYMTYYPGDEYVDVIGLTGYNTGTYFPGEQWRDFNQIYDPLYNEYLGLFPKPFMISEFGSNSVGGNKVQWINTMFDSIKKYDNIKVAIWWSGIDYDKNGIPGRIYLIDEDEEVSNAFRSRLKEYKPMEEKTK